MLLRKGKCKKIVNAALFVRFFFTFCNLPWDLPTSKNFLKISYTLRFMDFDKCLLSCGTSPGGSEVKASACNAGDLGSIPGSGRSPGEGNGNPLQYSCLENPMGGGAGWATVHRVTRGCKESDTTEWLDFHFPQSRSYLRWNEIVGNFLSHYLENPEIVSYILNSSDFGSAHVYLVKNIFPSGITLCLLKSFTIRFISMGYVQKAL